MKLDNKSPFEGLLPPQHLVTQLSPGLTYHKIGVPQGGAPQAGHCRELVHAFLIQCPAPTFTLILL